MPSTTAERQARWPGGDQEAAEVLMAGGWRRGRDWVWRHPEGKRPTVREFDAAIYLAEEWDEGGIDAESPE